MKRFTQQTFTTLRWKLSLCTFLLLLSFHAHAQTWTGATDDDWNKATNWNPMTVPDGTVNVVIDDVSPNPHPVIKNGTNALAQKVNVNANAQLTINSGGILSIEGSVNTGLVNRGTTVNNGTIVVDDVGESGIYTLEGGSFTNNAAIMIGTVDGTGGYGIRIEDANSIFINETSGNISIKNTNFSGMLNQESGQITNKGAIAIETVPRGINNFTGGIFLNESGTITIDDTNTVGIGNRDANSVFTNQATITIGATATITEDGIHNFLSAEFINEGMINIDDTNADGIRNNGADTQFTNKATITIGATATITEYGIQNLTSAEFINEGTINIDDTGNQGINNADENSRFTNFNTLNIGLNKQLNGANIINRYGAIFINEIDGEIYCDNSNFNGIVNREDNSTFTNKGAITISETGGINQDGILNLQTAIFNNEACATIKIFDIINNSSTLTNNGAIFLETTEAHTVGDFTNNGLVSTVGSPFEGATNNEIIIDEVALDCGTNNVSPAFDLGEMLDFTIDGVFLDENAMTTGGTYDQASNTFSPTDISIKTYYVKVTDNACASYIAKWEVFIQPIITCPNDVVVDNDSGACFAAVDYTVSGMTDCTTPATPNQIQGIVSGADFPIGTTSNTFEIMDGDLRSECSFTVTVNDTEAPVLTFCPSDIMQPVDAGNCSAVVEFDPITATDNCVLGAQGVLASTYNEDNGQRGVMFDLTVVGTAPVLVRSFDANLYVGTSTYKIYYKEDTYEGSHNDASAWTLAGTATGLTSRGRNRPTPIPIEVNVWIQPGQTYGFYVTNTSGGGLSYTEGGGHEVVFASNAHIEMSGGRGKAYPFGQNYTPRKFNGTVHYGSTLEITQTEGLPSGSEFPLGVTDMSFDVKDEAGNTAVCDFEVTVTGEAPSINCPEDIIANTAPNQCSATVDFTAPLGTDNCDNNPTTVLSSDLGPSDVFPLGETTVTYEVTNASNLTADCSFTVTVVDNEAPTLQAPQFVIPPIPNAIVQRGRRSTYTNVNLNNTGETYAFVAPNATVSFSASWNYNFAGGGGCTGCSTQHHIGLLDIFSLCHVAGAPAGSGSGQATTTFTAPMNPGIYYINQKSTWWNNCGDNDPLTHQNTSDNVIAVLIVGINPDGCINNFTQNATLNECGKIIDFPEPTFVDNCLGQVNAQQTAGLPSGSLFPVGTTTLTYEATDAVDCSFTITIVDNQAPSISCPDNITMNTEIDQCTATVNFTAPIGTDNCDNPMTTLVSDLGAGDVFPLGETTVSYRVTDGAALTADCSFTVTVIDNQAPSITCPESMMFNNEEGQSGATVTFTEPMGMDNCTGAVTIQTSDLGTGDFFPFGITTVSYQVTDAASQTADCSFTIEVSDNEVPEITCPDDIRVNSTIDVCGAVVTFEEPVGTDNAPGAVTTQTSDLGSGDEFPVGISTVSFEVTDAQNQSTNCSFIVTVDDVQAPQITCPDDMMLENDVGQSGATVTFDEPIGTDNCTNATTMQTSDFGSGDFFPFGATMVAYRVTDAANQTADCSFTITIADNTAPQISCPDNIMVDNDEGICSAMVVFDKPVGTDNAPGAMTVQTSDLGTGDVFPLGVTTVSFEVRDAANQTANCSFTITVSDNEAPQISCPNAIMRNNDTGQNGAIVNFTVPTGTDNCEGATTIQTSDLGNGNFFPIGTTTVSFEVTDALNQTANCSFTIMVKDNEAPQISCLDDIIVNNDGEACGATVNFDEPLGTDNAPGAVTVQTSDFGSGDFFSIGETTVSFEVTDAANLENQCSFTITVNDNDPPTVTDCFDKQYITMDADCATVLPDYRSFATMVDNCSDDVRFTYTQTPEPQSMPSVGQYEVYILATDPSNNSSSCTVELNICPPSSLTITNVEMNQVAGGNYSSIEEQLSDCVDIAYTISHIEMVGDVGERNAFVDLTFDLDGGGIMDCIVVASETGGALAVHWLNFEAKASPRYTVDLAWQVRTDETVDFYSIERSIDGIYFETIDELEVTNENINLTRFKYEDKTPFRRANYYRILQHQVDGSVKGSPIRTVSIEGEDIALFPNPTSNHFQLILPEITDNPLPFQVFSMDGRLVYQGQLAIEQQRFEWSAQDLGMSSSGIYFIKIQMKTGKVELLKLSVIE